MWFQGTESAEELTANLETDEYCLVWNEGTLNCDEDFHSRTAISAMAKPLQTAIISWQLMNIVSWKTKPLWTVMRNFFWIQRRWKPLQIHFTVTKPLKTGTRISFMMVKWWCAMKVIGSEGRNLCWIAGIDHPVCINVKMLDTNEISQNIFCC